MGGRCEGSFRKAIRNAWFDRQELRIPAHSEGAPHRGIRLHDLFRFGLIGMHLIWRGPFLRHQYAANKRTVADRQK